MPVKVPILNSLVAALDHAQFDDDEVEDQLSEFIEALDRDLTEGGYEAGSLVEAASARLDQAVGAADNLRDEAEDEAEDEEEIEKE